MSRLRRRRDPIKGILNSLSHAAESYRLGLRRFLGAGSTLIYGTTHAINAIITGNTARTAFLTTAGARTSSRCARAGEASPWIRATVPQPLVPRSLTWEIAGRIVADGTELHPLDELQVVDVIRQMTAASVEAVGVCFGRSSIRLMSCGSANSSPRTCRASRSRFRTRSIRQYGNSGASSSACIDASLKPMMRDYFASLEAELVNPGSRDALLVVTSLGGVVDAADVARAPVHLINSGPSIGPSLPGVSSLAPTKRQILRMRRMLAGRPMTLASSGGEKFRRQGKPGSGSPSAATSRLSVGR